MIRHGSLRTRGPFPPGTWAELRSGRGQGVAELLETADGARLGPLHQREAVKGLDRAVVHHTAEAPLHNGGVLPVKEAAAVPDLHPAPGVPLLEPVTDGGGAVVLGAPAFKINGIGSKELQNTQVFPPQPHVQPAADLLFPFLRMVHMGLS